MTIIIQEKANIQAIGKHVNGNAKPVICIETGEVFHSGIDAAEYAGVAEPAMSMHLCEKRKTCKGMHYCFLSKLTENIDAILFRLRETAAFEAKAKKYDAIMAEREAEQERERKRQQAIDEARAKVASLENELSVELQKLEALEDCRY
jgi:hypothetical protein